MDYLTLCPSCHHTASLHYPDGCHGKNFQCDCMRSRDELYGVSPRGETARDQVVKRKGSTTARRR